MEIGCFFKSCEVRISNAMLIQKCLHENFKIYKNYNFEFKGMVGVGI